VLGVGVNFWDFRFESPMAACITLLTDFGHQDAYVGVLKGVILQTISPGSPLFLVDLTHGIAPQDVAAGSFQLGLAYPYFTTGTVHLAIVDPGVGSQRRGIAIQTDAGYLVGPDNGLFSHVLAQAPALAVVSLTNPDYWRTPQPSATFHGRDIFAPVAAHLASGVPLANLGRPVDPQTLAQLPLVLPHRHGQGWRGRIQAIDTYGNLITNLPAYLLGERVTRWYLELAGQRLLGCQTYSAGSSSGAAIALVGSHGWLEIAIPNGHAQRDLTQQLGVEIQCGLMVDLTLA
jgi:S-adenosyl-L-methionine hydrolase (adenosine-forming)